MKTALITGGGSGIGLELVRLFAREGYAIVVFSLDQDELDALEEELLKTVSADHIHLFQADLSLPGAAAKVAETCDSNGLTIDVLVNNAGFCMWGEFVEGDGATVHSMMQLNMIAVAELAHEFGRRMKARGSGRILNIGSTLGISPVPVAAVYGGTKAFVNSFSVALHHELAPYGVTVSCMEPFLTRTKFLDTSLKISPTKRSEAEIEENIAKGNSAAHSPEDVARQAYEGLMKGKPIIMPGKRMAATHWIMRVMPQSRMAGTYYKFFSKEYV